MEEYLRIVNNKKRVVLIIRFIQGIKLLVILDRGKCTKGEERNLFSGGLFHDSKYYYKTVSGHGDGGRRR